jgi:hypothetical protein
MNGKFIAVVAVGLVSLGAPTQVVNAAAHDPLIVWQGGAEIVSFTEATTGACSKAGAVGDLAVSVFRPRLDPAEPVSALSLTFSRAGMAFFRTGGTSDDQMRGVSSYASPYYGGRVTSTTGGNTGNIALTISPGTPIVATTDVIAINGTIGHYFGLAGCSANFRGAYRRRTD